MNERLKRGTKQLNDTLRAIRLILEHQHEVSEQEETAGILQYQCSKASALLAAIRAARQESRPTVDNSQSDS